MRESFARQIIDPTKELLRWGPIQGRFFFMSEFCSALFHRINDYFPGHRWPNALALTKEGSFLWLDPMDDMRVEGRRIFETFMLPDEKRNALYASWKSHVAQLCDFQKKLDSKDLSSLSQEEFEKMWSDFYHLLTDFWMETIPAELGNYGSDRFLEETLRETVPADQMAHVMEVLTAPESPSFYQEEEVVLLETSNVDEHQHQYYWLKNSYAGSQVMPVSFFAERKGEIPQDIRERIEARFVAVRAKKAEVIRQFYISDEAVHIAHALRIGVEWQDERKKYIFQGIHYKDMLLREVARRYGYDFSVLLDYSEEEIREFVFTKKLGEDYRQRSLGAMHANWYEGTVSHTKDQTLDTDSINALWHLYTDEQVTEGASEFKGIIACKGTKGPVRGTVRILLDPRQSDTFKPGEILVTTMTTPEFVFVMKNASAILTDTGGLTSHAAIVSRELGVPCLVGTKVATKILKDGDEVEVDAEKGIVRILQP